MTKGITTIAVAGLLTVLAILVPAVAAEPQPKANADDAAQLTTLLKERVEVLTRLVANTTAQYHVGTCSIVDIVSAQIELTAAQLDATEEPEKRVVLLKKQLDAVGLLLEVTKGRYAAGHVTEADVCRAKSLYLDVKIKWLRESIANKATAQPAGK